MSTGSRNKNLLVIIAVLLLTNVTVLGYFLWYKKSPKEAHYNGRDKNVVGDNLKNEVGFDTAQLSRYKEMREKQKEVLRPMFDDMRKAKDSLFGLIGEASPDDSLVNKLAQTVGEKQQALDLQTFRYFSQVRELCKPGQEAKYDSLLTQMFRKMGRPKGGDGDKRK